MSSVELTTERSELSGGILGIIGAYGMQAALDVRDLYRKPTSESSVGRGPLATGEESASAFVRQVPVPAGD
jgi:hypothetical protein